MIPSQAADINAAWLSAALAADIDRCELEDSHSGTTGRAVLRIYTGAPLPRRLFAKLPPEDKTQQAFVISNRMGWREVQFYQQLSEQLPVRTPRCYFAQSNDEGSQYVMLMEHLQDSQCQFRNASRGDKLTWIRAVLSAFAKLHAYAWNSPRFETDLNWLQPPVQHPMGVKLVSRAKAQLSDEMPAIFSQLAELYTNHADAMHQLWQSGEQTIIHGDVHDGNLFSDNGEPGLLDWALVARGPAMRDVGYFLAATLPPQEQHQARHLLGFYRDELSSTGITAPPLATLWQQYQWHAVYVWMAATCTAAMGDAWQPSSYVAESLSRLHQTLEIIEAHQALSAALR